MSTLAGLNKVLNKKDHYFLYSAIIPFWMLLLSIGIFTHLSIIIIFDGFAMFIFYRLHLQDT